MRIALESGDLVDAALVAAAEIGGSQEGLHHFQGGFASDDTALRARTLASWCSRARRAVITSWAKAARMPGDFVGGDGNPDAGAASRDA